MRSLRERLIDVPQVGRVTWIGVRGEHGAAMRELSEVEALFQRGLAGDVTARSKPGSKRQVTLMQEEHLPVLASLTGLLEISPHSLRRNLVVASINLIALVRLRFSIGPEVVLLGTGPCSPCGKMDVALGDGGFQALRGHGGITAQIERGGTIRLGDAVRVLAAPSE